MKTRTLFLRISLLIASAVSAFGMAGPLRKPSLAFPEDYPLDVRTNVIGILQSPDFAFAGGEFIHSTTSLHYTGSTTNLNVFLSRLAQCPKINVSISMANISPSTVVSEKPVEIPSEMDWSLSHSAFQPDQLHLQINVGPGHIRSEELVIPKSAVGGEIKVTKVIMSIPVDLPYQP